MSFSVGEETEGPAAAVDYASIPSTSANLLFPFPLHHSQSSVEDAYADDAAQTAAMMRSEMLLLEEQKSALRNRRLELERQRDDLLVAAVERLRKFLPPRSAMLQRAASGAQHQQGGRDGDDGAMTWFQKLANDEEMAIAEHMRALLTSGLHGVALRERLRSAAPSASPPILPSRNTMGADVGAESPLLDRARNGGSHNLASALTVPPLMDTVLAAQRRQEELWVAHDALTLKDALMCQRATAMLSELRTRMERRGELLRRRAEWKRAQHPAALGGGQTELTSLSPVAEPHSPSYSSSASSILAAPHRTVASLTVQRNALLTEWKRLRDVLAKRDAAQQKLSATDTVSLPSTTSTIPRRLTATSSSSPTQKRPVNQTHHRDDLGGTPSRVANHSSPSSMSPWVLPEQFLTRREMVQFQ